jgi:hypothetical protein
MAVKACALVLFSMLDVGAVADARADRPVEGLDFPVANVGDLAESYCFGIFPWDAGGTDTHDGIDLVARYSTGADPARVAVVAAADARVERIVEAESGAGLAEVIVVLALNRYWYMAYTFEPQTANPAVFDEQRRGIAVREKQHVKRGEPIGDLVVADVAEGSYPHVHFTFLYKHPDDTLEDLFARFPDIRRSDGSDLAPRSGHGSPWKPQDLGMQTTLYCPYEYSTPEARAAYDSLASYAASGDQCRCICAYGSVGGNCGTCGRM